MVEIGSIIRATVSRIEPYGVYLDHAQGPVIVLLPEVSWSDRRPLPERVRPGEVHDVLVIRYNYRTCEIVCSMRRLDHANNPYRQLARLEPGTVLRGRVVFPEGDQVSLDFDNGAIGHAAKKGIAGTWKRGDEVDVVISAIEVVEGRLSVDPVGLSVPSLPESRTPLQATTSTRGLST